MPQQDKSVGKARRLTRLALLSAVSLILFVVEQQIPLPVPIAGIRLGLANIVNLFAVYTGGRRDAAICLTIRILLGNLVCGTVSAMLYSAAGGLCCLAVLCLLCGLIPARQAWVLSILCAAAHILGQLAAAAAVLGTHLVFAYAPILLLSAMLTGAFTGIVSVLLLSRLHL